MPANQHFPDKQTGDELSASEFNTVKNNSAAIPVPADQIDDEAVTTPKLGEGSVTTPKLADDAVTVAKAAFMGALPSTAKQYFGMVNSDGTAAWLPSGWSVTSSSSGYYEITHNLGLTANGYFVLTSGQETATVGATVRNSDEMIVRSYNSSGSGAPVDFIFMLVTW